MKQKLESLTPEQQDYLAIQAKKTIDNFLGYQEIDRQKTEEVITFVYSLIDKPCPKIYVADSPMQAQMIANELKETKGQFYTFGTYLTSYWASFYAFYDTFVHFGIVTEETNPLYFKLREYQNCGFDYTIEFENAIVITKKQKECLVNENGLHCLSGPAIYWLDGYGQYYINGRIMPEIIFTKFKNNTLSRKDFFDEENEDVRAGIYELIESKGEGSMLSFLNASCIDEQSFIHENGEIEQMKLFKTEEEFDGEEDLNGKSPACLAWLKMSCPSTGQNYLIPTDSSFSNCIDAAKYHRPNEVPKSLDYKWNSRN